MWIFVFVRLYKPKYSLLHVKAYNYKLYFNLSPIIKMTVTLPTIDIKWKKYVLVKDRIKYFNETYPNWSITTERIREGDMEIIKATVIPDCDKPERKFTGYSQAKWWDWFINKTSCLENAESSSVWRALAFMWIGIDDSIASADEVAKVIQSKN